jgi:hypothetical protein
MARPLLFHDPGDPLLANHSDAFMLGPYFLVAPVVVDGQRDKSVYLPEGTWVNYWTDSVYTGGTTVLADAPLDRLPLFVRAGAVIPMQHVMDYVGAEPADSLFLDVFPTFSDVPDTFCLYEDDGESLDYMQGEYARIPVFQSLRYGGVEHALEITVDSAQGSFPEMLVSRTAVATVRLIGNAPSFVLLNSDTLDAYPSSAALFAGGDGYSYDAGADVLLVKFEHAITSASVIAVEGVNLPAGAPPAAPAEGNVLLGQNRPNPFVHGTSIGFTLQEAMRVRIEVFDALGRRVTVLLDEERQPGRHLTVWDGRDAHGEESPPGGYFYRLSAEGTNLTGKMILVR